MFGTSMAAVGTVDHDVHRLRRAALNPFFSKKSIADLEPVIQAQVDKLCSRLGECKGQVVNLSDALACLSGDVISDCAFGETYGLLDGPDFAPEWRSFMMDLSLGTHLMKQFGSVYQLIMTIVPWLLPLLHPLSRKLERLRISKINLPYVHSPRSSEADLTRQIEAIRASPGEAKSHRTFFHSLLAGDLPPHEKSTARLTDEALTIIGAGTVTTSHTIALTLFHVLANPSIKTKLRGELRIASANGSSMTWSHLAQLPYLTAVVTEGLRLASGVSHRLQRIDPDHALYYKQYTILAGTPVSQTQMFIMTDSTLFPQPMDFVPDRWLADCLPEGFPLPNEAKKHFVPFSRGTRSCVGMNMAYAEIYLTIAAMLSTSLDLTLFETTGRNFEVAHDWFNPCPPLDSKGLRVMIG